MTGGSKLWTATALALFALGANGQQPASEVAWTKETRRVIQSGDPQRGEEIAADCASCHGPTGVAPTRNFPSLAAQPPEYTYKQLRDYQDGSREHAIMGPMAETLSEQDIADVAAWYAQQDIPSPPPTTTGALRLPFVGSARAQEGVSEGTWRLIRFGDAQRHIAPCMVCHGAQGEGSSIGVPALAGQTDVYLRQSLLQYKNEERTNDTFARMRLIAKELSDDEIAELAEYYAELPGG